MSFNGYLSIRTTLVVILGSDVMVGKIFEDGKGAIELLGEDDAHHLMGEGHLRKGYFALGKGIYLRGKSIRSSYNEDEATAHGIHSLLEPLRKAYGGELLATLIEQDDVIARLNELNNLLPLALLLLFLREVLHIADVGNNFQLDGGIVVGAGKIVVDSLSEIAVIGLANGNKESLHLV